jgi:hypothetical protein
MRRREFIIALGGTAVWPLAALAQQAALRIVGVLDIGSLEGRGEILVRPNPAWPKWVMSRGEI